MSEVATRVRVHGRVQGVFFRQSCRERAKAAGVRGWVTNSPDGTVEALFVGAPEAVDQMVDWCHSGPPSASVSRVSQHSADPGEAPAGFDVR